jgi:hypothetical protein
MFVKWYLICPFEYAFRTGKARVDIALAEFVMCEEVPLLVDLRCTILNRLTRIEKRRQRLVSHFDQLQCLFRDLLARNCDQATPSPTKRTLSIQVQVDRG